MPEIRYLTYNMMLKPSKAFLLNNDFKAERLKLFITNHLQKYDLVCLQETFDTSQTVVQDLLEGAAEIGFTHFARSQPPALDSNFTVDGGLTILSRFPIVDSEEFSFPAGIGIEGISQKGCLYAKIQIESGKFLHVFNIHCQAHYSWFEEQLVYAFKKRRLAQLATLKRFIHRKLEEVHRDGDQAIISGDFNVDWNTEDSHRNYSYLISHFNEVDSGFDQRFQEEYSLLLQLLHWRNEEFKLRNVFLEQNGRQAVTFSDYFIDAEGEKIPKETVLTEHQETCLANGFDYIFIIDRMRKGRQIPTKINPKKSSCKLEEFRVDLGFISHLSDHYGISVVFEF